MCKLFLKLFPIKTSTLTIIVFLKLVGSPDVFFARTALSVIVDIFRVKFLSFLVKV